MAIESFLKRWLQKDHCVYWGAPIIAADARISFTDPIEIGCFWTASSVMRTGNDGREFSSAGELWTLVDLEDNSMVYHGSLTDLTAAEKADPRLIVKAHEVRKFSKSPSPTVLGEFERKSYLYNG